MKRIRKGIPHDLVDADNRAGRVASRADRATETDEEHGLGRSRIYINRAVEWDRKASLQAKAVQRIDHVEIFAVGYANCAVRVRQVHPASRVLRVIGNRKDVGGEGSRLGMAKIKERMNGGVRFVCVGRLYVHGEAEDEASDENATHTNSLDRDVLSNYFYTAELFHRISSGA